MNYDDQDIEFNEYIGGEKEPKKKRRYTKDDAIYGVFNEYYMDEDEDLSEEYLKQYKKGPVGFVSSGHYELNEDNQKKPGDDDEKEKEEKKKDKEKKKKKDKSKKSKGNSGASTATTNDASDKKYTGIGLSILAKMGYKSGGLGKEGTGMVEPLKVYVRPKNMALNETIDSKQESDDSGDDSGVDEGGDGVSSTAKRSLGWKKSKPKVKYDLDDHSIEKNEQQQQQPQIILDMRGPEARMYAGALDKLGLQADGSNVISSGPLSELKHNVGLLVNLKKIDINNTDNKLKHERDKVKTLTNGLERLRLTIDNDRQQITKVKSILETVSSCKTELSQGTLTTKTLYKAFKGLLDKYPREFQNFKLYNMDKELLVPLLKKELAQWNIGEKPLQPIKEFRRWKELYDSCTSVLGQELDNYFILIRDLILPPLKLYLRSQWQVKKPKDAVYLISVWYELLPEVISEALLEQSVLPKLKMEIEQWNPRTDPVPIHEWVLPWTNFLKSELETYYPSIRQKLISILVEWQPQDLSAHHILIHWKNTFEGNSMESLINRSIVPKLANAIKEFDINPTRQDTLDPLKWLFVWLDLINPRTILDILDKHFFPKWHMALISWLQQPSADFEEISNWYTGWKKEFPAEISSNDRIKSQFSIALSFMKKAMSGEDIRDITPQKIESIINSSLSSSSAPSQSVKPKSLNTNTTTNTQDKSQGSTKDMLEHWAATNGLLFMPSPRKTDTGQQIYMFSSTPIIIERDVVMHYTGNNKWVPANLQTLLEEAIQQKK
ncbi:hypothetical protein CYY_004374 [Polysphondylium violaceum]|uniref:G-patch domain-containing protein n=1 Tax=Polysphondylium violaceum TaxID=133409 RepID=A0A8J4PX49_9MYCE|nr:hypothetical protein CYY_004374 [Polysphondylium violaceum]